MSSPYMLMLLLLPRPSGCHVEYGGGVLRQVGPGVLGSDEVQKLTARQEMGFAGISKHCVMFPSRHVAVSSRSWTSPCREASVSGTRYFLRL